MNPLMTTAPAPRVGVGVILIRGGRVLLGKRRNAHGAGSWQFPGGHLEFGETIAACARREVREETGLQLGPVQLGPYTNDVFTAEGRHYVTLFAIALAPQGEPEVLEPGKCVCWQWFEWSRLPDPLFLPIRNLLAQGFDPLSWVPGRRRQGFDNRRHLT
ncbi:MAG: NUDIX hydrolase [Desulfobacteraceae bacterium]|jgi:8-oxo-dGTP diphosphatase